jgi:hypothetical protein
LAYRLQLDCSNWALLQQESGMKFSWSAAIALWTILSGPAMYGGPMKAPKPATPAVQPAKSPQPAPQQTMTWPIWKQRR